MRGSFSGEFDSRSDDRRRAEGLKQARQADLQAKFQGLPTPGEEIVPSKEPVVKPVTWLNKRSTVKLPVASANRPVPPVIVAISTTERTPGAVGVACPMKPAVSASPLAAVNL